MPLCHARTLYGVFAPTLIQSAAFGLGARHRLMGKGNRVKAARKRLRNCVFCGDSPADSGEHQWPDLRCTTPTDSPHRGSESCSTQKTAAAHIRAVTCRLLV